MAARAGRPALVIGSTGWTDETEAKVFAAASDVAIVRSSSYSAASISWPGWSKTRQQLDPRLGSRSSGPP